MEFETSTGAFNFLMLISGLKTKKARREIIKEGMIPEFGEEDAELLSKQKVVYRIMMRRIFMALAEKYNATWKVDDLTNY